MQSMKSVSQDVYEKTEGQTDKQTNKQTNKPTKQKDYTSPALAGAGDYNKATKQLEGYSRHSRQPSLNNSYIFILVIANNYIQKVRNVALNMTEKMFFS